jgi:hypothetical protein
VTLTSSRPRGLLIAMKSRWIVCAALALAGCPSNRGLPASAVATPTPTPVPRATPAAQAPVILLIGGEGQAEIQTTGLPAMSADGQRIVIGYQGEDGARAFPNLALIVKDRTDATIETVPVMTVDDGGEVDPAEVTPEQQAAFDRGNAYLSNSHAQVGWVTLTKAPLTILDGDETSSIMAEHIQASSGEVAVELSRDGHLVVRDHGEVVIDRENPDWLVADQPMGTGDPDDVCSNPPYLEDAWIAAEQSLALVRIAYAGTDTCWEPDSQYHVITWR